MNSHSYHLAQMSFSHAKAPLDDPMMAGFVSQLKQINALAEQSPGYIWRLQTADGDATGIRGFDDPLMLLNMSLWESVDALRLFVYKSGHAVPYKNARAWFHQLEGPTTVLWWVPKGHIPNVQEGLARFETLKRLGPTEAAFGFRQSFPAPEALPVSQIGTAPITQQPVVDLVAQCELETIEFHRFLERWLRGEIADSMQAARFSSAFASECILIAPRGEIDDKIGLQQRLAQARGTFPGIRIWIDEFAPVWVAGTSALVRYREWRSFNGQTTGRMSSALFRANPTVVAGVVWVYIHETWLAGHGPDEPVIATSNTLQGVRHAETGMRS